VEAMWGLLEAESADQAGPLHVPQHGGPDCMPRGLHSVFTKLDLCKGYYQVPVRPQDVPKTAVVTPFGLFEFLRMPFGLWNAGQTFQRLMDEVLAGLPFVFCYLDDVLIASASHREHVAHLREVLTLLQQHGLVLNGEKCELGKAQVDYLGHHVSSTGIQPLQERVGAIACYPAPTSCAAAADLLGDGRFKEISMGVAHTLYKCAVIRS
jgi:hypothetical protein